MRLLPHERVDRVRSSGLSCRQHARDQCDNEQHAGNRDNHARIHGANLVQLRLQALTQQERTSQSEYGPGTHDEGALAEHHAKNAGRRCAERHANPNLAGALTHLERKHAVNANGCQK